MAQQFNNIPNFNVPLIQRNVTSKDWYFFFTGLFRGLAPENVRDVVLGVSPYTYTATAKGFLIIPAGTTASAVEFSRDGTTFYNTGQTQGTFPLNAADQLRITYAGSSAVNFVPT